MKNVQDIYPATPMQKLMLLHAIGHRHNDRLVSQFGFAIDAPLDVGAFEAAWNAVLSRHSVLRTAFITQKGPTPLQVVRQSVRVPFEALDWRASEDITARFEALAAQDRTAGFDTRKAPLMRVTVVQLDEDKWRVLWTSHHLLMDRWCLTPLFNDLERAYEQALTGAEPKLAPAPSFRQYVDWLGEQDTAAALDYWRDTLRGFNAPTPLARGPVEGSTLHAHSLSLGRDAFAALEAGARRFAVSPIALVQGALALVLAEQVGRGDVVFGTAAAARPPGVANVESIVGSFVNNLPLRVRCQRDRPIGGWLRDIAEASFTRSAAEFVSPLDITEAATLPDNTALFDTLFVWLAPAAERLVLDMQPLWDDMATAYPVTVSAAQVDDGLTLHLHQYADDAAHGENVLARMAQALERLASSTADTPLATFMAEHVADAPALDDARRAGDAVPAQSAADGPTPAGRFQLPDALLRQFVEHQFAQALGLDAVAGSDDFFALGGNSLRAAQLHAQICQGTRKTVPLLTLFADPTVDGILATLAAEDWPEKPDRMLALRTSDHGLPLICVASPEVNTMGYFVLSRRLPPEQAMYVLQLPPQTDRPQPVSPDAIETLAEQYVETLRAHQPHGPYQLLGMCGGAHLATAMARLLTAAGERIAFFGVVNTWSLYSVSWVYYLHRARRVAAYYRRRVRELLPGAAPAPVTVSRQYVAVEPTPDDDVGLANPWIRDVGFAHRLPQQPPLPCRVHVFRLERQQYWRIKDPSLGWGRFFHDSKIVDLPGRYHDNLMREPYVADLAGALLPLLDSTPAAGNAARAASSAPTQQQEAAQSGLDPSLNHP